MRETGGDSVLQPGPWLPLGAWYHPVSWEAAGLSASFLSCCTALAPWADILCVLREQGLPAAHSHSSPGQVLGAQPCPCEWGGRDSSAAAGTHLCCSGNWELWTCPAPRLQEGLLCVIMPSFKLNYFASTSFLHFSEGGRGVCKEC